MNQWTIFGMAKSRATAALCAMLVSVACIAGASGWPDVRISVEERGMHYVSANDLATVLGISNTFVKAEIVAGNINLTVSGASVAYKAAPAGDGFYFFGDSIASQFTRRNVYQLKWVSGVAMTQTVDSAPIPAPGGSFIESVHYEDAHASAVGAGYANGPDDDYWWWAQLAAGFPPWDTVYCTNVVCSPSATATQAQLTVWVRSVTESATTNEHQIAVKVNGNNVGQTNWTGRQTLGIAFPFDASFLADGTNVFQVTASLGGGAPYSTVYLDSFDLTYERTYSVPAGNAIFKGGTNAVITTDGLTSSNIWVADLSDTMHPALLTGTTVDQTGAVYRVSFAPTNGTTEYTVFDKGIAPVEIGLIENSGLKSATNASDYVIIAPEAFLSAAQSLAEYRVSVGHSVRIAVLQDIYDEFSYGLANPAAIKTFLGYAYTNWTVTPKYVVLAGSGTWDYKNYMGYGDCIVPVIMLDLPWGLGASDGWFGDMDDDRIPEMAIGRLPAMTDMELQRMVDRIIEFEQAPSDRWQETVVLAADNPDGGGDFHASSDRLAKEIPGAFAVEKIYMTPATASNSHTQLVADINAGALLLNYFGHSGPSGLSGDGLLDANDVVGLTNSNRSCIVTAWSCTMGMFAAPAANDCLGTEFMLAPTGGAVAVWAPVGQAFNRSSSALAEALYHRVFLDRDILLGDAILGAMSAYSQQNMDQYLLSLYNLLGDPGLRFRGTRLPSDGVYSDLLPSFVDWKWDFFTEAEMDDASISGDFSDADGDGRVNLAEYAFGRNPAVADGSDDIAIPEQVDIGQKYDLAVAFTRNKWISGVQVKLIMSKDLVTWEPADAYIVDTTVLEDGNQATETVIYYVAPPADSDARFFRLRIE